MVFVLADKLIVFVIIVIKQNDLYGTLLCRVSETLVANTVEFCAIFSKQNVMERLFSIFVFVFRHKNKAEK